MYLQGRWEAVISCFEDQLYDGCTRHKIVLLGYSFCMLQCNAHLLLVSTQLEKKSPHNHVVLLPTDLTEIEQTRTQTSWSSQFWMRMTTGLFSPGPATGQRSQKTPKQVGMKLLLPVLSSWCRERNLLKRCAKCLYGATSAFLPVFVDSQFFTVKLRGENKAVTVLLTLSQCSVVIVWMCSTSAPKLTKFRSPACKLNQDWKTKSSTSYGGVFCLMWLQMCICSVY